MQDEIQSVPLAAFESQGERHTRQIMYMALGWAASVIALCMLCVISISYTEEVVTETETTTETQTLERVAQADNQGNAIVGDGDISIGDSNSTTNNNKDNDQNDDYENEV